MATCSIGECGRPVRVASRGWCSMHYQRWQNHGDPTKVIKVRRVGVDPCSVEGCNKPLKARTWCANHYSRWQRYGSPTARVRGEVVAGCRICPGCKQDTPLDEYGPNSTDHCRPCVARRAAEYRRKNPPPPVERLPRECDNCGATFMADARRSRYCTVACYEAHKNTANWPHLMARRARLAEVWVETFDRFEIFARDNWVCQICLLEIDRDLKHPEPGSASLDHIVPISRGGEHSRANAQASHLYCNTVKGARALEEVA